MNRKIFFSLASSVILMKSFAIANDIALIYNGPGTCKDKCAQAAANVATSLGLTVKFVEPSDLSQVKKTESGAVWIQPGGNAYEMAEALGADGFRWIRRFVKSGGGYVGFCAGAFLADKSVDEEKRVKGLGLIPVETAYYPIDSNFPIGTILTTYWLGQRREVFFNGGGTFYLNPKNPVKVLATYGLEGLPATIETRFGDGRVVVTGAHPEALDEWKPPTGLTDGDGSDVDLAQLMIRKAIGKE